MSGVLGVPQLVKPAVRMSNTAVVRAIVCGSTKAAIDQAMERSLHHSAI